LNTHLHCLVLDGVYRRTEGEPAFQAARPTRAELELLLDKNIVRFMKILRRSGLRRTEGAEPANRTRPGRENHGGLCVEAHGFSLHAVVRCGAHQRKELERLCRYIARPRSLTSAFRRLDRQVWFDLRPSTVELIPFRRDGR